jgi:hypothetical protein
VKEKVSDADLNLEHTSEEEAMKRKRKCLKLGNDNQQQDKGERKDTNGKDTNPNLDLILQYQHRFQGSDG